MAAASSTPIISRTTPFGMGIIITPAAQSLRVVSPSDKPAAWYDHAQSFEIDHSTRKRSTCEHNPPMERPAISIIHTPPSLMRSSAWISGLIPAPVPGCGGRGCLDCRLCPHRNGDGVT